MKNHRNAVLFSESGGAVACKLKQNSAESGWDILGRPNFIGVTFEEGGLGYFGNSFEVSITFEEVLKYTDLPPAQGWYIEVPIPNLNNKKELFYVEEVASDKTLGVHLLRCSLSTTKGQGKRIDNYYDGGI